MQLLVDQWLNFAPKLKYLLKYKEYVCTCQSGFAFMVFFTYKSFLADTTFSTNIAFWAMAISGTPRLQKSMSQENKKIVQHIILGIKQIPNVIKTFNLKRLQMPFLQRHFSLTIIFLVVLCRHIPVHSLLRTHFRHLHLPLIQSLIRFPHLFWQLCGEEHSLMHDCTHIPVFLLQDRVILPFFDARVSLATRM